MLQKVMKPYFSSTIRFQGEKYFRSQRLTMMAFMTNQAHFLAQGSSLYHCDLAWEEGFKGSREDLFLSFDMSCTCSDFERGGLCKHLWASIKEGDRQGFWDDFQVEEGVSPLLPGEEKASGKNWQKKLQGLVPSQAPLVEQASLADSLSFEKLYYGLKLTHEYKRVSFFTESQGVLEPQPMGLHEIHKLKEAVDRELVWLLLSQAIRDEGETLESGGEQKNLFSSQGHDSGLIHPALEVQLIKKICETKRSFLYGQKSNYKLDRVEFLEFHGTMGELVVDLGLKEDHVQIKADLHFNKRKEAKEKNHLPLSDIQRVSGSGIYLSGKTLGLFKPPYYHWMDTLKSLEGEFIPKDEKDLLVQAFFSQDLIPRINLQPNLDWKRGEHESPKPKMIIKKEGPPERPELYGEVYFQYGEAEVFSKAHQSYALDSKKRILFKRQAYKETSWLSDLEPWGLKEALGGEALSSYYIQNQEFLPLIQYLMEKGWAVEAQGAKLESAQNFNVSISSGVDWFDLKGELTFGAGQKILLSELMKVLKSGEKFIPLGDGSMGMLPKKWLEKHGVLLDLAQDQADGSLRFTRAQGLFLNGWFGENEGFRADRGFLDFQNSLAKAHLKKKLKPLKTFRGELRDYQEEGLSWLTYLRDLKFGGILADDMGLGKTVQVIALLQKEKKTKGQNSPNLIVAPKSLVFNWLDEIKKFAPQLRSLAYIGINREEEFDDSEIEEADMVITTYHTLRNDFLRLSSFEFNYMILDEAQYIKNPEAQISQACKALESRYRLALTGTPIENSIGDLFSILDFVNPGLVSEKVKRDFSKGSEAKNENLKNLSEALAPMILRRTKDQVLKELPPKVESVIKCELSPHEKRHYDNLKKYYQLRLSEKIKEKGLGRSKIEILEALLRLRQAACHPALIDAKSLNDKSAKLEVLFDQIQSLAAAGSKCLVFSQFTSFLQIIKQALEEKKIPHLYLDGKTRKRQEMVETFEKSQDLKVFLISLKAGGVGLNLTSANYVFILDPWWNPAVEAQAIDRTHRIGQKKNVFAYKLIAKNTVEEKILELQRSKKELSDAIMDAQSGILKKMSISDLNYLLS